MTLTDREKAEIRNIALQVNHPELRPNRPLHQRTIGEQIVEHEGFKNLVGKRGSCSQVLEFPHFGRFERATATSSGLTSIQHQPEVVTLGVQLPMVADLIPEDSTQSTTIRAIVENSYTNAATPVAEDSDYPEASWDLAEVDFPVRKIAVIGKVTRETLEDAHGAESYFNSRLPFMVSQKEDYYLLNGTGNSPQIKGLLQHSGIQTQAMGSNTVPDAIHKAITKIMTIGQADGITLHPDGIVMHPTDWENLVLMKDAAQQYLGVGPLGASYGNQVKSNVLTPMLWNRPVVCTTFIAQGTALVGAFRMGAFIHRKLGLTLEMTNSDGSDFKAGRYTLRSETRLALEIGRPLAFCTVTGLA